MRLRIYNKNVKWTKDSIDKPYFYSKENQNIRQNIDNYFNALTFTEYPKFKINGSDMDIKTITVDKFDEVRRNYCSILLNNKEYYYFIEKVDILNEKGLFRLSLQLDTWTTYFEEMISKFGNSVVALRKHGRRFKYNKNTEVIYDYSRDSNVWNIDGQFSNLSKQTILKYPIFYKYPNIANNKSMRFSLKLFNFEQIDSLAEVYVAGVSSDNYVEYQSVTGVWKRYGAWKRVRDFNAQWQSNFNLELESINLSKSYVYTRVNQLTEKNEELNFNATSASELLVSYIPKEIDIADVQSRLDNTLFFDFNAEPYPDDSIDIGNFEIDINKIKSLTDYRQFIFDYIPKIINGYLFIINVAYVGVTPKPWVFISVSQSPLGRCNLHYIKRYKKDADDKLTSVIDAIGILLLSRPKDIENIGSDIFNKLKCIPTTGAPSGEPEYFNIKPLETIDMTNDAYDWKREPQIWMSHCYDLHLNRNGNKTKIRYEIDRDVSDFGLYQYTLVNMFFEGFIINSKIENAESMFVMQYNPEVPSVTDSYKAYLKTNQNSLQTSMYGIQKNIDFTKQSSAMDVKQAQVSAAMSGISSVTNAVGGVISGALGGVFSGPAGMIAGGVAGAVSGVTNMANTIAQGAMGVEKAQLNAEKNNFTAEHQMRSAVASQLDLANTPDKINGGSIGEFERFLGRERHGGLETIVLSSLPTISTIKEYADYLNRYGYLSGNQIHDFSKDRILMRKRFNYWQIQDLAIGLTDREGIPLFALKYFRELFNNGVRMWSDVEGMYDYSKENWEYEIFYR